MKLAPRPWTHHHTHRMFHISLGICFAFIVGMLCAGFIVAWGQTMADENVTLEATVGSIEPGPTETRSGSIPKQSGQPRPLVPEVKILLRSPNASLQFVDTPQGRVQVYVFNNRMPVFLGTTNIPNALIFVEIHPQPLVYGTAQAGQDGTWLWQPPEELSPGMYKILVTAQDPNDEQFTATASLDFLINPSLPSVGTEPVVPVSNAFFKKLFGIFLTIPDSYKKVLAGNKVELGLRLYSPGDSAPKDITYSMIGTDNEIIFEVTEALPGAKELAFKKTFFTHFGARAGIYTIKVKVPQSVNAAVASETFEILPTPLTAATSSGLMVTPIVLLALSMVILAFIFLTIFAYRKVRALTRLIKRQNRLGLR